MRKIVVLVALTIFLVAATPVLAGGGRQEIIPSFDAWLQTISSPQISIVASIVLSWIVGLWPAYSKWETKYKRLFYGGICIVIPVGAACLRAGLGYVAWSFDPLIWHALWYGVAGAVTGTTDYHMRKLQTANATR